MLRQQPFFYGQLQDKHAKTAARAAGEARGKPGRAIMASLGVTFGFLRKPRDFFSRSLAPGRPYARRLWLLYVRKTARKMALWSIENILGMASGSAPSEPAKISNTEKGKGWAQPYHRVPLRPRCLIVT